MSKKSKKETKKPVAPSKSGVRRGEPEDSKAAKILTVTGLALLGALVLALVISLIVVSIANKKPKDSPFQDLPHLSYDQVVNVVVDHQLAALNEEEHSREAYRELIKTKSYIIFYRTEDLKDEKFVEAAKALKSDNVGVVFFNLSLNPQILEEGSAVLTHEVLPYSDPKLLPFVIVITESQSESTFIGEMDRVLNEIKK